MTAAAGGAPDAETVQADAAAPAGRSAGRCQVGTLADRARLNRATVEVVRRPAWAARRRRQGRGIDGDRVPVTAMTQSVHSDLQRRRRRALTSLAVRSHQGSPVLESVEMGPWCSHQRALVDVESAVPSVTGSDLAPSHQRRGETTAAAAAQERPTQLSPCSCPTAVSF